MSKEYIRDSVKLVIEEVDDDLVITYADLNISNLYTLTIDFVGRMSEMTGQKYNDTLDDLKEIEEIEEER